MRSIVCNLYQNLGSIVPGNLADLSTHLVKVGSHQAKVDDQLTKVSPGELTVEIQDPDDSIWTFIKGQLAISGGLLPPFLQVVVGGAQRFIGIVDPSRIIRHLAAEAEAFAVQITIMQRLYGPTAAPQAAASAVAALSGWPYLWCASMAEVEAAIRAAMGNLCQDDLARISLVVADQPRLAPAD